MVPSPVLVVAAVVVKESQLAGSVAHGIWRKHNAPAHLGVGGSQLLVSSRVLRVGLEFDGTSRLPALVHGAEVLVEDRHEGRVGVGLRLEEEAGVHAYVGSGVNEPGLGSGLGLGACAHVTTQHGARGRSLHVVAPLEL